ncbi:MAG: hypothetical protein ACRC80_22315 [Waterburya sp.]
MNNSLTDKQKAEVAINNLYQSANFFLKVISFDKERTCFCLLPENIIFTRQAEIWVKATIYSESNLSRLCNQTNNT